MVWVSDPTYPDWATASDICHMEGHVQRTGRHACSRCGHMNTNRCWGCARFVAGGRDYCDRCEEQESERQQRSIEGGWL